LLYAREQDEQSIPKVGLTLPGVTRWYANFDLLCKVQKSRHILERLQLKSTFKNKTAIRAIKSDLFWNKLHDVISLFRPMINAISLIQSNKSSLSDVVHVKFEVSRKVESLSSNMQLEQSEIKKHMDNRWGSTFLKDGHYLAYYLDHRYSGSLTDEVYLGCLELLKRLCENLEISYSEARDQLSDFECKASLFGKEILTSTDKPISYWKGFRKFAPELSKIALRLLTVPPSSANIERVFSHQKRIHSLDRNRLKHENVKKLIISKWWLN